MSKKDFNEQEKALLKEKLLDQKAEYNRNIEIFLAYQSQVLEFEEQTKKLIAEQKDEQLFENLIFQQRQEIVDNIGYIEILIEDAAKSAKLIKPDFNKIISKNVDLISNWQDLNKFRRVCLKQLEDLLEQNPDLQTQLTPKNYQLVLDNIFDLTKFITTYESPLYVFLGIFINSLRKDNDEMVDTPVDFNELVDYIMKNMNLSDKTLEEIKRSSTAEQLLQAIGHYKKFFLDKYHETKSQLLEFDSNHEIDSNRQNPDFKVALKEGNLKDLINIFKKSPVIHKKELELRHDFEVELKNMFKQNFLEALKNFKLEEFVRDNIGPEIVCQFSKYKEANGDPDYISFAEDISVLKDHNDKLDDVIEEIIKVFSKIVLVFGIELNIMRNSSKEKFYSNMVEATMNVSFLGSSPIDENKQKEKINKSNNRHLK